LVCRFTDRGEDSGETETIFTTPDGKYNSGFHFKNPMLNLQYDLVNYNATKKVVYLDLELEYLDGLVGKDAGHVMKSISGIESCPSISRFGVRSSYMIKGFVPKISKTGPATSNSGSLNVIEDATIVWARGHIHSGGMEVILSVNGKDQCVSKPTYNKAGVITEMSICPSPISLKKGDKFSLRGTYDLTKHGL
jgi:hypothetical protein